MYIFTKKYLHKKHNIENNVDKVQNNSTLKYSTIVHTYDTPY